MKKITQLFLVITVSAFGQSSVDFETDGTGTAWTWTVDDNGTNPALEFVSNPNSSGINTSSKVAKFTATAAGEAWALAYTDDIGNVTFSENNSIIKIKVRKTKATTVGLKFEDTSGTHSPTQIEVANTVINGNWEELTFNFGTAIGNTYNRMVIIPDLLARSQDNIIYFDEISFNPGGTKGNYNLEDIDFESSGFGANWVWTIHNNHTNPALEIVDNPNASGVNTTTKVAKFTSLNQGAAWALTFTDNIGFFKFDQNNKIVTLMVRKSVISDVAIKFEIAGTGTHVEKKRANTISDGSWEQLTFDFSSEIGNSYNRLVIIPDFANRSQDNVSYFDQLSFGSTANLNEIWIDHNFKVFPNPAKDTVQFSVNSNENLDIEIFDMLGKSVLRVNAVQNEVNIADLNSGLYFVQMTLGTQQATKKLVVN